MDAAIRLKLLRIAHEREPARSTRDLMTLAGLLMVWVETRRFREEPTPSYTEGHTPP